MAARKEQTQYGFGSCFVSFVMHVLRFDERMAMTTALIVSLPIAWGERRSEFEWNVLVFTVQ